MNGNDFHTFSEYMKKDDSSLTASMEDYIEMIYRLSSGNGFSRIHELSQALNIQPSSATKMVQRLAEMGYVKYEKYGFLMLREKGKQTGAWLLKRHMMVESFLRIVGVSEPMLLEETEKIEHTLSGDTASCLEAFVQFMMNSPDVMGRYAAYKAGRAG